MARKTKSANNSSLNSGNVVELHQVAEVCPLKLTSQQRRALIQYAALEDLLKEKLKHAGEGTQVIGFNRSELEDLSLLGCEPGNYPHAVDRQRLLSVRDKATELLEPALKPENGDQLLKQAPANKADLLFQVKITLKDIHPPIWRRIQIPDVTLGDLHQVIQALMGWEDGHMHEFVVDGERYGHVDSEYGSDWNDEDSVLFSEFIPEKGRKPKFLYVYDFGDSWEHEIVFEGYLEKEDKVHYPRCLAGARATPPEDCGGPYGYGDFVEAMLDRQDERHEELVDWYGGKFNPEKYSIKAVNAKFATFK